MRLRLHNGWLLCLLGVVGLCLVPFAQAFVVLGEHDWNETDTLENWTNANTWVTLSNPNSGGVTNSGYLNIDYDGGAGQADLTVYTAATNLFAGDWSDTQNLMWVEFDFWQDDIVADSLWVQFQSSTNSQVWSYSLTVPGLDEWTYMSASLAYSANWNYSGFGGDEDLFLADLATIDWVGVYIDEGTEINHDYGLDNWKLMVPEPADYALACAALLVVLLAVRRRRTAADTA